MTAKAMSEDQMVHLLRNALLVAGHEMSDNGDQMPVVNATIHDLTRNWEDTKAKRNALDEVKKYYETMIEDLVAIRNRSALEVRGEMDDTIIELRTIYRACFDEIAHDDIYLSDENMPEHLQRAAAILDTLGEENDE